MQLLAALAFRIGAAGLFIALIASQAGAQVSANATADVLTRMRAELAARRYAAVIAEGNGLLESARSISTPERIQLWQLMAAAYYPSAPEAQQPDSAKLPLEALVRFVPDIKVARDISWPGLDSLTEHTRAQSFAVVSRPLSEYVASDRSPAHITVVASRPTRLRLVSVHGVTGRTVSHDSAGYVTVAALQLRTHDALGAVFTDGVHELHLWAYDSISGDSLRIAHRVRAVRRDIALPATSEGAGTLVRVPARAQATVTAPPALVQHRSAMLWGGLALAAATAVVAQEARPDDGLRAAFRVDDRAFVVGAAMAGAAIANFFARRPNERPPTVIASSQGQQRSPQTQAPATLYQVRLQIDPAER